MKTTTVRGIPDEVYDRVKREAEQDHRSVNAQIIHILAVHALTRSTEETQP